ncbi:MAG TPA: stage V sporulation protein E, partial [Syntrophomonas wolfei]|nr:stage V sporulation protein E [Syntrophomonas wolfei]
MRAKKGPPDFILFITTMALLGIGLVMVFSSSAVTSNIRYDDAYHFFKRQLYWAILGIMAMLVIMKINYSKLKDLALPLMVISLICLVLVITPLGIEVNESKRWLGVGFLRFSPSELAKLGMIMLLARTMDQNLSSIRSFSKGVLPYLLLVALVGGFIMLQP